MFKRISPDGCCGNMYLILALPGKGNNGLCEFVLSVEESALCKSAGLEKSSVLVYKLKYCFYL